jgi:quercetin dioxygenase-like cupin family protein
LILSLYDEPHGVVTGPGNRVVYDLDRGEAHAGSAAVEGRALRWELEAEPSGEPLLSTEVAREGAEEWLLRCDRVDFPPGGVAYRHTHPGPGIRCLLSGAITIESGGRSQAYGPLDAWFESGPEPVFAAASASEQTSFVRALLVPAEYAGRRTIRYVDPEDEEKPKTQRATVFLEEPVTLR